MKLESLKSSKFEAFEGNVITNAFKILGGTYQQTYKTASQNLPSDCYVAGTEIAGQKVTWTDGTFGDLDTTRICPVGQGEGQGGGLVSNPGGPIGAEPGQICMGVLCDDILLF